MSKKCYFVTGKYLYQFYITRGPFQIGKVKYMKGVPAYVQFKNADKPEGSHVNNIRQFYYRNDNFLEGETV